MSKGQGHKYSFSVGTTKSMQTDYELCVFNEQNVTVTARMNVDGRKVGHLYRARAILKHAWHKKERNKTKNQRQNIAYHIFFFVSYFTVFLLPENSVYDFT